MTVNYFNSIDTLYDVDFFQRMLDYFMSMKSSSIHNSPCIVEEGFLDVPLSLTPVTSVANLVDLFLADVNLKLSKFQSVVAGVPDYAHPQSNGNYCAIDIFLKAHPWLAHCEREQICRFMNIQKLSLDASTQAAQNERLPLRVIVQVLFFEQLRLHTSIAGWVFASENEDQMSNRIEGEVVRAQALL
ncbi:putative NPH3 domain-containing protein [Helianthus annuus]|nr:putative NPH3 domain-containing protein [Helianthus annuus]